MRRGIGNERGVLFGGDRMGKQAAKENDVLVTKDIAGRLRWPRKARSQQA